MAGNDTLQYRIRKWVYSRPGKRGIDIPAHLYDRIFPVANGITQQTWGRPPTPEQMQHLYDHGLHEPHQIHSAYDALPHPHAPNLSVGDYARYSAAYTVHKEHS